MNNYYDLFYSTRLRSRWWVLISICSNLAMTIWDFLSFWFCSSATATELSFCARFCGESIFRLRNAIFWTWRFMLTLLMLFGGATVASELFVSRWDVVWNLMVVMMFCFRSADVGGVNYGEGIYVVRLYGNVDWFLCLFPASGYHAGNWLQTFYLLLGNFLVQNFSFILCGLYVLEGYSSFM